MAKAVVGYYQHVVIKCLAMVKSCCAPGCENRWSKGSSLSFYRFPADPGRRAEWVAAVRREKWEPTEHSWLCSAHFVSGSKSNDRLSPDYVPSVFSHTKSPRKRKAERDLQAFTRRKEARKRRSDASRREVASQALLLLHREDTTTPTNTNGEPIVMETYAISTREATTMTDTIFDALEGECYHLRCENVELKETLKSMSLTKEALDGADERVKFYTGLPSYAILMAIFNFVAAHVPESCSPNSLTNFQQFLMVLMKLRLNLFDKDLAYRSGVSQSSVSRYFAKWIDIMFVRLQPLVKWPGREELQLTMPVVFRKEFNRCVAIIDCFEVFCERPKSLKARAQTWSNYKHHNTVKFLIAIAPQGVISFVSKGWGGRASDKHITENSGILSHLLPGDQILADRGFNVEETAGLYCAEVKIPPFTKGKKQLSKCEVDTARELSRIRIHIERVIGLLRQKYTILEATLPINSIMTNTDSEYSTIDKIVVVCAALCNCCNSVVPTE